MNSQLQQFIHQIVESTKLQGKVKNQLLRELTSHILEEEKELQLQGCSSEKIIEIVQERWGNTQMLSQELFTVHSMKYTRKIEIGILIFMLLSMVYMFFGGCRHEVVIPNPPQSLNQQ